MSYSDYHLAGLVVVTKRVDLKSASSDYVESLKQIQDGEYAGGIDGLVAWLVAQGYVAPVEYSCCHLGEYGQFEWQSESLWEQLDDDNDDEEES